MLGMSRNRGWCVRARFLRSDIQRYQEFVLYQDVYWRKYVWLLWPQER